MNRGFHDEATIVENDVMLMAYAHVGHDCHVAHHAVLVNSMMFGGHVQAGPYAFIGGGAGVHQFIRLGESAMIGGNARVAMDVPPFCMMVERNDLVGLNLVGLKRRGFDRDTIRELKTLYHAIFGAGGNRHERAESLLPQAKSGQARQFLEFVAAPTKRGLCQPRQKGAD